MKQEVHITLWFDLSIGEVCLNEIVYELNECKDTILLRTLEKILMGYDDLICNRLSNTKIYRSPARKGLGRHLRKGDPHGRYCRGRKVIKRGYRQSWRTILRYWDLSNYV